MVDLNLVKVFITIFDTKSVSMAAKKLNITQPSVSHSLARLRYVFKDQLFTRSKEGMLPTFYATKLYEALNKPLLEIESVISESKAFDVYSSAHCFKIAMSDLGAIYFVPLLIKKLEAIAPHVSIEVISLDQHKIADWLISGRVDAAIYDHELEHKGLSRLSLFHDRYICMLANHTHNTEHNNSAPETKLSLQQYLTEQHAVISSMAGQTRIDAYLRDHGLKRNISLRVSQLSIVIEMVEHHQMIATLPARIGALFQDAPHLKIYELPFELAAFELSLYWHKKHADIVAQKWFIEFLKHNLLSLNLGDSA